VVLVFFAEILNTALEHLVDLAVQEFDEKARVAKDAAAAGVLVLAIGTLVIFAALVVHNWGTVERSWDLIARQVALGLPLAVLVALLLAPFGRPRWVDVLFFLSGLGLMAGLLMRTQSTVFSTLTLGVFILAGAAARERQRFLRA
jgi:diacylglycerol kinase (ATP)